MSAKKAMTLILAALLLVALADLVLPGGSHRGRAVAAPRTDAPTRLADAQISDTTPGTPGDLSPTSSIPNPPSSPPPTIPPNPTSSSLFTTTRPSSVEARVERGPIASIAVCNGKVISNLDMDIRCKNGGTIINLPFDVSDTVHKGDLLVELDRFDEEHALGLAQASLDASQARLVTARQSLVIAQDTLATSRERAQDAVASAQAHEKDVRSKAARMGQLLAEKLTSQEDFDTSQVAAVQAGLDTQNAEVAVKELDAQELALELRRQDIKLAEAQVASDKINLDIARQHLLDTKVCAPIDGIVSARYVQPGQILAPGTTVLTLSDLTRRFISAMVDERKIGMVRVGQEVHITADAYPGVEFHGRVVRVSPRGINFGNTVDFEVKIELYGENQELLRLEMTTNVEIVLASHTAALLVPMNALTLPTDMASRHHGHGQATVVVSPGQTQKREVEIGISDGNHCEVVKGLKEGETVLCKRG